MALVSVRVVFILRETGLVRACKWSFLIEIYKYFGTNKIDAAELENTVDKLFDYFKSRNV